MVASQENLGDLKLYRIPEPVTVAANSQKQVGLLTRPEVRIALVYRQGIGAPEAAAEPPRPAILMLTARNRAEDGLGVPLPAGSLALFGERGGRPILLGEGTVWDHAVGQDVEIELGEAPGVTGQIALLGEERRWRLYRLTATNDRDVPVSYQAVFYEYPENMRFAPPLGLRGGWPFWTVTIPANSSVTLDYRVKRDPAQRASPAPGTR